jgi:hypothetical protein
MEELTALTKDKGLAHKFSYPTDYGREIRVEFWGRRWGMERWKIGNRATTGIERASL